MQKVQRLNSNTHCIEMWSRNKKLTLAQTKNGKIAKMLLDEAHKMDGKPAGW